jgi:hypothetical protein
VKRGNAGRNGKQRSQAAAVSATSVEPVSSQESLTPEEKRAKRELAAKRREEKELALRQKKLREEKWEGRAGGLDVPRESEVLRQQQLKKLKNNEAPGGNKKGSVRRGSGGSKGGGGSKDDSSVGVRSSTPTSVPEDGFPPVASAEPRPTTAEPRATSAEPRRRESKDEAEGGEADGANLTIEDVSGEEHESKQD